MTSGWITQAGRSRWQQKAAARWPAVLPAGILLFRPRRRARTARPQPRVHL